MDGSQTADQTHGRRWFIRVDEQTYGPFDDRALWTYMCEGRVTPQSFVSQSATGSFRQIAGLPGLLAWFEHLPGGADPAITPQTQKAPASVPSAPITVALIMAEIRSGRSMGFLQVLQTLGDAQRIGDTTWLLQSSYDPVALHDVLTPPLGPEDRMFVVDISNQKRAGFNLGQSVDARMAELFKV